jgi:hypothetical protein
VAGTGQEDDTADKPADRRYRPLSIPGNRKAGIPEENLAGFWSRRIDETNRLVYAVGDSHVTIISCRYHYHYQR